MNKKVCIMGLGYIGLPTAALLANKGYQVHGVDIFESVVKTINDGNVHIVEPDLDVFVRAAVRSGKLKAALVPEETDVFMIAVPTPFKEGKKPDVKYVMDAVKAIAPFVKAGSTVILESTSPVGTTEEIAAELQKYGVNLADVAIAYCPERVLPGNILRELVENDRVVGGIDQKSTERAAAFYRSFVSGAVLETTAKTAEMTKLTENSFRDVNIAFANELSMLCDQFGIDVWELIGLANRHPRVNILKPGCGVGGHCIAVDPWFIVSAADGQAKLIESARNVNDHKPQWVIDRIMASVDNFIKNNGKKPVVACMGVAFKPDIDDLRESPALHIAQQLKNVLSDLLVVEPNIKTHHDFRLTPVTEVVGQADILVFLVGHREFRELAVEGREILDFCGIRR
jgi:UDP-N-acetyl-D-mannosaminuronic acid dehydrogenase